MESSKGPRLIVTDRLCLEDFADSVIALRSIDAAEVQQLLTEHADTTIGRVTNPMLRHWLNEEFACGFGLTVTHLALSDVLPLTSEDSIVLVSASSYAGRAMPRGVLMFRAVSIELDERLLPAELLITTALDSAVVF